MFPQCADQIWDLFYAVNLQIKFGTYSMLLIFNLGPIPHYEYCIGTYSTVSIFHLGPIPQSQNSFWHLFHSLIFFPQTPWVELVPIEGGKSPNHFGTISTPNWDLFHPKIVWD